MVDHGLPDLSRGLSMRPVLPIFLLILLLLPLPALAYLGPVLGLGVIGSVIAVIVVALLSGFSFIYVPVRNWLERIRKDRDGNTDQRD